MTTTTTAPAPTTTVAPPTTVALAALNAAATPLLTAATNYNVQLMATGQQDAAKPDALNMSPASPFEKWRNVVDQPSYTQIHTTAYNQARALYNNANQPVPSNLTKWNTDDDATYADIGLWQVAEVLVLIDKSSNVSSASDQAGATSAYGTYRTDLAKAHADISGL